MGGCFVHMFTSLLLFGSKIVSVCWFPNQDNKIYNKRSLTRSLTCIRCHLQVCRTSEVVPSRRESPWTLCPSAARTRHSADRSVDQRSAPPWGNRLQRPRKELSNRMNEDFFFFLSNEWAKCCSYPHCWSRKIPELWRTWRAHLPIGRSGWRRIQSGRKEVLRSWSSRSGTYRYLQHGWLHTWKQSKIWTL